MPIIAGVFVVIAARDPLKHILWLQLAMVWSFLDLLATLYILLRGVVTFSQAGFVVIINVILLVAFLALYPWHKAPFV
jgi:hypothetical protein